MAKKIIIDGKAAPKILKQAAKDSRQNTAKIMAQNPGKYEVLTITPQNTGSAATKAAGNTRINTTTGARIDPNRGTGFTGPKSSKTHVGRGKTNASYIPGSENIGKLQYPIPIAGPVLPTFIPIPGLPGYPSTPPVITPKERARIESVTPQQKTLSEIIRGSQAQVGDTLQFPSGEQIVYQKGNSPKERIFDVTTTKTYDAANIPQEQYYVPGRTQTQWTKTPQSANKYIPAVPKGEAREKGKYYPTIIKGNPQNKPLQ